MKPEQLSIAAKDLHRARLAADKQGPSLPEPTRNEMLRMTVTAAWANRMLETPVYTARKCPILPSFIPRAVGHGVTVVRDDTDSTSAGSVSPPQSPPPRSPDSPRVGFHGGAVTDGAPARCPYQEGR